MDPALLDVHLAYHSDLGNYSNCIDCPHLLELIDVIDPSETKSLVLYAYIIVCLFDLAILVKDDTVVVLDRGVLLVGHLDLSIGAKVHLVFLKHSHIFVGLIIEKSGLNLRALVVDQLNVQKGAFSTSIFPLFESVLFGDSGLDLPVKEKGI